MTKDLDKVGIRQKPDSWFDHTTTHPPPTTTTLSFSPTLSQLSFRLVESVFVKYMDFYSYMMKVQFSLGRPALFKMDGIVRRERKQSQTINLLIREEEMLAL